MSKSASSEGTKIAQAAKDLNVTSVTIRRYLSEFNIETQTDENGVKVLPPSAMEELQLIRQLKEDGLTNPKVLEELEERRAKPAAKAKGKAKTATRATGKAATKERRVPERKVVEVEEEEEVETPAPPPRRASKLASKAVQVKEEPEAAAEPEQEEPSETAAESGGGQGRSKHTLTCQTCGKVFEHMNPRLRDCLDCYRTKRKERRRGGPDKHKNVIQHPVVQQVIAKSAGHQPYQPVARESHAAHTTHTAHISPAVPAQPVPTVPRQSTVRNYRKAIEETRSITASLKRRLERPDLPEGERRWLEQIYAYQLILHQGWRHLAEYKAGTKEQNRSD